LFEQIAEEFAVKHLRSWYIYLASAVSLLVLAFQSIALLRGLLATPGRSPQAAMAFQVAAIIVALPFYIVHWLWAQRVSREDLGESKEIVSVPRRLYLYIILAVFSGVLIDQSILLVRSLLDMVFGVMRFDFGIPGSPTSWVIYSLCAILVASMFWVYHWFILRRDLRASDETLTTATIRQVYIYGFSAVGLLLFALGAVAILRILLDHILPVHQVLDAFTQRRLFSVGCGQLIVGLSTWILSWRYAQSSFEVKVNFDQRSIIRKIYLYLVLFISAIFFVTYLAMLLSVLIGRLVNAPESTGNGLGATLSTIAISSLIWFFHARVLQNDLRYIPTRGQQAQVQRLYRYLMAGVGLVAFLVGLAGVLSVLVRGLSSGDWVADLRQQFSWFSASLFAGLPVWLLHWLQIQSLVDQPESGVIERRSFVRSFYLYFFLLAATISVLASLVYIVSQVIELWMGDRTSTGLVADMGQAIAYCLIGVVVWLYHGAVLRQDRAYLGVHQVLPGGVVRITIDSVEQPWYGLLVDALEKEIPGVEIIRVGVEQAAGFTPEQGKGSDGGPPRVEILFSTGRGLTGKYDQPNKILLALPEEGWLWAGAPRGGGEAVVRSAVSMVRRILEDET